MREGCNSTKGIEEHHISYNPPVKIFLCRKHHQEEHNINVIEGELTEIMRQYRMYNKMVVSLKNWKKAWNKQFTDLEDSSIDDMIIGLESKKKVLLKEAKYVLGDKVRLCNNWKGVGIRYLAGLLAFAQPSRFPSLWKFLYYCVYKEIAKKNKNYSHYMCSLSYEIANSLIRSKNDKFYPLYLEIKEGFKDERTIVAHRKALNRIATLFLKDFYLSI